MTRDRIIILMTFTLLALTPLTAQAAPYGATYAPGALTCLTPNQVKTHPISLTNTGTNAWTIQRPGGYHLSYHWFQGPNQVVWDGERTYLPYQVNPNQPPVALQANLKAPPALGTYTLKWDMLQEAVTWFSWNGVPTGDQTVQVKEVCFTGPFEPFVLPPKIDVVVPFISNITPGGYVAIKGSWFGNDQGELWLKGLKKWDGTDYGGTGNVKLAIATERGKDFWKPTSVLGIIKGDITQVKDQPVKLQIKRKAGKWSNEYPVNFRAAKDWVTLKYTDPAVKLISCGTDANLDECNGKRDPDDGNWFSWNCAQTFYGFHYNVWGAIGDDSGTDKFEITVKNGWVIDGGKVYVYVDQGEGSTLGPGAVPSNVTSWKPSVFWNVSPNDDLCHGANVYIVGPKGVPWK